MRRARRGLALLGAAVVASCTVDVDLEDRACPCADGYVCDPFGNTCIAKLCAVTGDELVVAWATPHTLAFEWGPIGEPGDFHEYELVVADSEADVRSRSGSARVQSQLENPALGSLDVNGDLPMFAVVSDLLPGTEYFARLYITDNNACVSRSAILTESTPLLPQKPIVLFDGPEGIDVDPDDIAELVGEGSAAYVEYALASDPSCTGADLDPECGQPVKLNFAGLIVGEEGGPTNLVEPAEFDSAYLEVVLAYDSTIPARFATVFLSPTWPADATEAGNFRFDVASFSLEPSPTYRSIEVPLRKLHLSEGSFRDLSHADLLNLPINQAAIGGQWHEASVVRIEAIRIYH